MNTNKKEISMKKGQKVRILRTNQVATIVEVELIRKSGNGITRKNRKWLIKSFCGFLVLELENVRILSA